MDDRAGGWGSSSERHIGKCQFAMWVNSHASDLPDTPDWHTYPLKSGAIACNMSANKELGP
jgi:hypothetical protein